MVYPIIRRPTRPYPLPKRLKELDEPHSEADKRRYARVDRFKDGYDPTEDPTRKDTRNRIKTIISKM